MAAALGGVAAQTTTTTTTATEDSVGASAPVGSQQEEQEERETDEAAALLGWNTVEKSTPPAVAAAETTAAAVAEAPTTNTASQPPAKKKTKRKATDTFLVPAELQPADKDSKFEQKRKKRAVQRLRQEWEAARADTVATKKAASWQTFAKRKGPGSSSMFQTDATAKVGVVGTRKMTKFEGPKKHK